MSVLDHFTDDDLLEELVRRRNSAKKDFMPARFCEDCMHFKTWEGKGDPPVSYNPCKKKHSMEFHAPSDWNQIESFGFYRIICSDRQDCPE